MNTSRRRLLAAGAAAVGAAAWTLWRGREPAPDEAPRTALPRDPLFPNPLRLPGDDELHGVADVGGSFTLVGSTVQQEILPGKPTAMLAYALEYQGRRLVNPLLRVQTGANLRVRYWNALGETSIVHWHGLKNDTNNDGHPHYAVDAGETYDYQFTVANRAGTYWYHPHPHHLAGRQAYLGLAGLFIVEDPEEIAVQRALDVKLGVTDVPLLIQDKRFDANGALSYSPGAQDHFHGYCGDTVLLNLTQSPCFDADTRLYRFRLVNGSNARIYRLAFMHGEQALEFQVIGADGGLLERPLPARELFLSPSERADVVLDLRGTSIGDRVMLSSLPFDAMQFSTRAEAAAPGISVPVNGAPLDLMLIRVAQRVSSAGAMPEALSLIAPATPDNAATRVFTFDHHKGAWHINRGSYRMTETAFSVARGSKEIWEFRNPHPAMPHPVHVHGFQYRMLERKHGPAHLARLAVDARGLPAAETGWKDSVLLWPGETLRMLLDFTHPFSGDQIYMLQCHNLEHEAHGMMINFRVAHA
ncbi:MAG: Bilirubin oxidase [Betaproteobacteria bacterium]|nr:Bilirubin oxidase [Betaproteobacteria bacterium]